MKLLYATTFALLAAFSLEAQVRSAESAFKGSGAFTLVSGSKAAAICFDANDDLVIGKTATLLAADVEEVTGIKPSVSAKPLRNDDLIIVGTIEKSSYIKELAAKGKIDIAPLEGGWERYLIQTVDNPMPGVRKALVIAGSDRRGAAFGLLSVSEAIGVSPWYWWADAPIEKKKALYLDVAKFVSPTPSVKYRGIFINDEDWGLTPWAAKTFEPEVGNIGPKTYAKVCELLLRLKANYLAPAMHPVSTSFNQIPENKMVADTFAIVMGSTHCEPLLLNTASEWDRKTMGEWNFDTNKDKILEVLTDRVEENSPYENVYTLALRGLHDAAMGVGMPMEKKVRILEEALLEQRGILAKTIDSPIETVPQAFTPYKEVLEIYSNGLKLPDDVTIVWPDDNFGYLKQLSNPNEQKRSGRAGVYYHASYLGVPHSYLWFSTTPPALMYEELRKAYDTTADRVWLLNCGDLKACEMQISFFLAMGYDIDRFGFTNASTYPARWLAGMFGERYYSAFEDIYGSYIDLAFPRKPEYMGWGYHWNTHGNGDEQRTDTEFSLSNYNEADKRLAEYTRIANIASKLLAEQSLVSDNGRSYAAMFELVYYPIKSAELLNRMIIGGQRNRLYARQGRSATNAVKDRVQQCFDSLYMITDQYNDLLDGKWKYVMAMKQNYGNISSYFKIPILDSLEVSGEPVMALQLEQEEKTNGLRSYRALPSFSKFLPTTYWVDLYNRGTGEISWNAIPSSEWIILDKKSGKTQLEERITVSVDWNKVPKGNDILGHIDFSDGKGTDQRVLVSAFNPQTPTKEELKGLYVQENGYISIPATDFHRKRENDQIKMTVIDGLGIEGQALQLGNPVAPLQNFRDTHNVPFVEYDFYTFDGGLVDVYTYVLPTFPLHSARDFRLGENNNSFTKYSVRIDNRAIGSPSTSSPEYSYEWYESVQQNYRLNKTTLYVDKAGKHTLQIRVGDPGVVLQKIVIDMGGLKKSYLGPESTKVR